MGLNILRRIMMPLLNHLSQKVSALLMGLVALLNHLSQKSSVLLMGDCMCCRIHESRMELGNSNAVISTESL